MYEIEFEDFCGYSVYSNGDIYDQKGDKAPEMALTEVMVLINSEWVSKANLLARLFLPYEEGKDYVGFNDGNWFNWNLDNLYLTDDAQPNKITLTAEERTELVSCVEKYLDGLIDVPYDFYLNAVWRLNGGDNEGYRAPIDYFGLDLMNQKTQQFAPVVEVIDYVTGCHVLTASAKEIHEQLGVNVYDTYKGYAHGRITKQGYLMVPLALVPKQFINAHVVVHKGGKFITEGSYVEICQKFNLHYESLTDILNYASDEIITYQGFNFAIKHKGDKKND